MGMTGNYIAVDGETIVKIASGELQLEELNPNEYPSLDIDKSWQAILYTLCGEVFNGEPPLGYLVPLLEDQALDFLDYGAFYVSPEQVAAAVEAISGISEPDMRNLYNFEGMVLEAIYPVLEDEDRDEFFSYMFAHFADLRSFYETARTGNQGIIFWIS